MKTILGCLFAALFFAGMLGHFVVPESELRLYFLLLLFLTLAAAAMLGIYWSSKIIQGAPIQVDRIDDQLSRLLEGHLRPLQGVRPKIFLSDAGNKSSAAVIRVVGEKFSSSFMCSLLLLGLFGIVAAEFFGSTNGVFGSLLGSDFGRGVSVLIGQYIVASAGGFVFAGFRLRLK